MVASQVAVVHGIIGFFDVVLIVAIGIKGYRQLIERGKY